MGSLATYRDAVGTAPLREKANRRHFCRCVTAIGHASSAADPSPSVCPCGGWHRCLLPFGSLTQISLHLVPRKRSRSLLDRFRLGSLSFICSIWLVLIIVTPNR